MGTPLTKKVLKNDGSIEEFRLEKVSKGIWFAARDVGGKDDKLPVVLAREVVEVLETKLNGEAIVASSVIGEAVEKVLIEKGHAKTAKSYIVFRENKKHLRQDKSSMGVMDDIGFSYNTLYILKQRYLKRNEKGEITETPKQMI